MRPNAMLPLILGVLAFVIAPHESDFADQLQDVRNVLQPADASTLFLPKEELRERIEVCGNCGAEFTTTSKVIGKIGSCPFCPISEEEFQRLFPKKQEPREEVIQVSSDDASGVSLPPDSLDDQPELTDTFATVAEFLEAGRPDRLIVFSADWCGLCQAYKQTLAPWQPSKSFDAKIQIVDIDRFPHLSRLFNVTAIPATHDGTNLFFGAQSHAWLSSRIPSPPTVETGTVAAPTPSIQSAAFYYTPRYVRPMTKAEQRRAMRRARQ